MRRGHWWVVSMLALIACGGGGSFLPAGTTTTVAAASTTHPATSTSPTSATASTSTTTTTSSTTSTTTTTTTTVAPTTTTLPWGGPVGPGWFLVMTDHSRQGGADQGDLELGVVSPDGVSTKVGTWPAPTDQHPRWVVPQDWTADGRRALLYEGDVSAGSDRHDVRLVDRNLVTGDEQIVRRVDDSNANLTGSYADPAGTKVIVYQRDDTASPASTIDVVTPDGATVGQLWSGAFDAEPSTLAWPAEHAVLIGDGPMLLAVHTDGSPGPDLPALPGSCRLTGWWTEAAIMAACSSSGPGGFTQVWVLPTDGSTPVQLTHLTQSDVVDFGALSAWELPDGSMYVQRYGDCGAAWVEPLSAGGTAGTNLTNGYILSVYESRLGMMVDESCDGTGGRLVLFDPVTEESQDLLTSRPDEVGILAEAAGGHWLPRSAE